MIDGNQLREEFGRYLAEHKATRWGMDAALMHVCKIAYDAGKADGPGAALHSREYEIEVAAEPGLHPLKFTGLPLQNWRDEQLLAHIQRGAVLEGWKEATIAWEVCASIHREYAKKKDPFFTTRQADFVKHTEAARAAMLAHIQRGAVLDKPARVGNGIFGAGLPTRYVIEAAQRLYEAEAERGPRTLEQIHEDERVRRKTWEMFNGPLTGSEDIQRGAVPEGWQVVPKEPTREMCRAGLAERHDDLAKSIYTAMLAAAPAPDHFRDDAEMAPDQFRDDTKMMAEPAKVPQVRWATCPETNTPCSHCPTKRIPCQAMTAPAEASGPDHEDGPDSEGFSGARPWNNRGDTATAPAEVPMPEPDTHCYDEDERRDVWSHSADQMRTYGTAREAAGYAHAIEVIKRLRDSHQTASGECQSDCDFVTAWDSAIDALRGEVKP